MTLYLVHNTAGGGGVEKVVADLADGFRATGVEVCLVRLWGPAEDGEVLLPPLLGLLTTAAQRVLSRSPVRRVVEASPAVRRVLARRLRRLVPDLAQHAVVAMDVEAGQVVAEAGFAAAPTVVQWHNSFRMLAGGSGLSRLQEVSGGVRATLMLTEPDWLDFHRAAPHASGGFLRNPTRLPVDAAPSSSSRERLVIGLGRLEAVKNFQLLLRAWHALGGRNPGWRLELYGSGSEEQALRALAEELELGSSVRISPWLDDTRDLFGRASVLAIPSLVEGMPLVILEAFARGVAVVATASSPGVAQLVGSGRGVLVEDPSVDAFADALAELLADEERVRAAAVAAHAYVQSHALPVIVEEWRALLCRLGWVPPLPRT